MKSTKIKLETLTTEQMLNHENKEYNPRVWANEVNRYAELGATFYMAKKDEVWGYDRFFVSYKIDGLFLFKSFSAYSPCLTNNGFTRVLIKDGEVFTIGFGENKDKRVANHKEGRKWLALNLCQFGVMVSNDL